MTQVENKSNWVEVSKHRWERSDGAVVRYQEEANYFYACSWKKGHKGWLIYGPDSEAAVSYSRKDTWMKIAIKFTSAERAMARIDKLFPIDVK